jgi:hypothetical protein
MAGDEGFPFWRLLPPQHKFSGAGSQSSYWNL